MYLHASTTLYLTAPHRYIKSNSRYTSKDRHVYIYTLTHTHTHTHTHKHTHTHTQTFFPLFVFLVFHHPILSLFASLCFLFSLFSLNVLRVILIPTTRLVWVFAQLDMDCTIQLRKVLTQIENCVCSYLYARMFTLVCVCSYYGRDKSHLVYLPKTNTLFFYVFAISRIRDAQCDGRTDVLTL